MFSGSHNYVLVGLGCVIGIILVSCSSSFAPCCQVYFRILPNCVLTFPMFCSTESMSLMSAAANVAIGAGGLLRHPPPYFFDDYIWQYVPRLDARWIAMMPIGRTRTMTVGAKKRGTAYVGWGPRCKYWGGRCNVDSYTNAALADMPFLRSFEEADYVMKLNEVVGRFLDERSVPTGQRLSLWCGSDRSSDEWLASNNEYWAKDIAFKTCLHRNANEHRKLFVDWHNMENFGIPPQHLGKVFEVSPL